MTYQSNLAVYPKTCSQVTPLCHINIDNHVALTFQKINDRLSNIKEKVQKIEVMEEKLDKITKDLWRMTKLLEEFVISSDVSKESHTDQICKI